MDLEKLFYSNKFQRELGLKNDYRPEDYQPLKHYLGNRSKHQKPARETKRRREERDRGGKSGGRNGAKADNDVSRH